MSRGIALPFHDLINRLATLIFSECIHIFGTNREIHASKLTAKMHCNEQKHFSVIVCQYSTLPNCCAECLLIANSAEGIIILQILGGSQNILLCFVPKTAGRTTKTSWLYSRQGHLNRYHNK